MLTYPPGFTTDAILCDSAATADGKLYVQGGGWTILGSPTFPFLQPRIALGVVIGVPFTATNHTHNLRIQLLHEDGQPVPTGHVGPDGDASAVEVTAQFNIGRPPMLQHGEHQTLPFAVNFDQLRFESPGTYSFSIKIDDDETERLVFRIVGPPGQTISTTGI